MKFILSILAIAMSIGMQGCATVTKGTKDTVQVQVSNCSLPMDCTATNKKGSWPFVAPGPVKFKKSDQDLTITCNDGGEVITRMLSPTRGGMIWGNVLIGGVIGVTLDAVTDAHWNMSDTLILHRKNCGQNNLSSTSQKVQPTSQKVQPTSQKVQPTSQKVQPTSQKVQPTSQKVQPTSQKNQAAVKPHYIVAPRLSRLRAVDARDKDDCEFITSISRNVAGKGDVSTFVKSAKNSALTEAANNGADSYFIVSAESTSSGASVTLEALKCK
jgi:hypothetical protein